MANTHQPDAERIVIAKILSAHGLKGVVKIESYTDKPLSVTRYQGEVEGKELVFQSLHRQHEKYLWIKFEQVDTRSDAEQLLGKFITIDVQQREKLEDDQFYWTDLEGLDVYDAEQCICGRVMAVFDYGAGTFLEIKDTQNSMRTIPFHKTAVIKVDMHEKYIIIEPSYLL